MDIDAVPSKVSVKLTILGFHLCIQATDAIDCQQLKLHVGDVILIMHRALPTEKQPLGLADAPVMDADLSLTAVSLMLHGAGRGLACFHCMS